MNVMIIFGAAMIFIGMYLMVQAVKMKKRGELIGNPILAEEEAGRCKDKEGFIAYIYRRELLTGMAVMIMGAAVIIKELAEATVLAANLVIFAALLVVLWFFYSLSEARSTFLY